MAPPADPENRNRRDLNLSPAGLRAVRVAAIAASLVFYAFLMPVLLIAVRSGDARPLEFQMAALFLMTWNFQSTVKRVVKAEVPGYPLKAAHYSPSQREWLARKRKRELARLPLVLVLAVVVYRAAGTLFTFANWLLWLPPRTRYPLLGVLVVLGALAAVPLGTHAARRHLRNAAELMAH